jgi:hypothetical protein
VEHRQVRVEIVSRRREVSAAQITEEGEVLVSDSGCQYHNKAIP